MSCKRSKFSFCVRCKFSFSHSCSCDVMERHTPFRGGTESQWVGPDQQTIKREISIHIEKKIATSCLKTFQAEFFISFEIITAFSSFRITLFKNNGEFTCWSLLCFLLAKRDSEKKLRHQFSKSQTAFMMGQNNHEARIEARMKIMGKNTPNGRNNILVTKQYMI